MYFDPPNILCQSFMFDSDLAGKISPTAAQDSTSIRACRALEELCDSATLRRDYDAAMN
jgi:hypothetical protein